MSASRAELDALFKTALSNLFTNPIFSTRFHAEYPEVCKALLHLDPEKPSSEEKKNYAIGICIAYIEKKAHDYYIEHRMARAYCDFFMKEADQEDHINRAILDILNMPNQDPLLKEAIIGILRTSLTATSRYDDEAATRRLNSIFEINKQIDELAKGVDAVELNSDDETKSQDSEQGSGILKKY